MPWTACHGALVVLLLFAHVPATHAGAPPEDAVLASFPFERVLPDSVYIQLPFESGRSVTMLVDTGATFSYLGKAAARSLGVKARGRGGLSSVKTDTGHELAFLVPDTGTRDQGGKYGVLGANFLHQFVLEIDFAAERIRLLDPAAYQIEDQPPTAEEAVVPITTKQGRPFIPVRIAGEEISFVMGLGARPAVTLSNAGAKRLSIKTRSLPKAAEMLSANGRAIEPRLYDADSVTIAGFELGPTPILVANRGYYGDANDPVVGFDALSQFTLRIDYPNARTWLRRTRTDQRYLGLDYPAARQAGVVLWERGGEQRVYAVLPGTPAEALGLQVDDALVLPPFPEARTREGILAYIGAGKPLAVRRSGRRSGDPAEDLKLPDAARYDGFMEDSKDEIARAAAEAEVRAREERERKLAERVYAKTDSGWEVVDPHRIAKGPREGEEWFSYQQFLELRAAEAEQE